MLISDLAHSIAQQLLTLSSQLDQRVTLSVAESCTGGQISSILTSIPGASRWFEGGIVAYTYGTKRALLSIPIQILDEGLVTNTTAEAMADQVRKLTGSYFSLSITGVAGPDSSEGYPPLSFYVGVSTPYKVSSKFFQHPDGGRVKNQSLAVMDALCYLQEEVLKYN